MRRYIPLCALLLLTLLSSGQTAKLELHLRAITGFQEFQIRPERLTRGMPLIFQLSITSGIGFTREDVLFDIPDSLQESPEVKRRLDSIFAPIEISANGKPWYESVLMQIEADGQKKKYTVTLNIIEPKPQAFSSLIPGETAVMFYGLDPGQTRSWNEGGFRLRMGLMLGRDTLWTEQVKVVLAPDVRRTLSEYTYQERIILADYWIRRNECKKAEPVVMEVMLADSANFIANMLMAQLFECQGNLPEAFRYYRRAFLLYEMRSGTFTEPPDLLINKMMELQRKMLGVEE